MLFFTKIFSIENNSLLLRNFNDTQAIFTFARKFFIPQNPKLEYRINNEVLFLHDSDFQKLKLDFGNVPEEKEGWYTTAMLSKYLKVSSTKLKPVIDSLRIEFPQMFEFQKKKKGPIAECFHFDIAKKAGEILEINDPRGKEKRKYKKNYSRYKYPELSESLDEFIST